MNDAFLGAWNSIPPHKPEILSSYLARLTRNISLNKLRSRKAVKRMPDEAAAAIEELLEFLPSGQDVAEEVETRLLSAAINRFLGKLPSAERRIFMCRYWYYDSVEEIAGQFGYSRSKVKSMLYRLRKKLFAYLKKEELL